MIIIDPSKFAVKEFGFKQTKDSIVPLTSGNTVVDADCVTTVLALDCEMCSTKKGRELTRVTVINR
jgi:hypothetical protein